MVDKRKRRKSDGIRKQVTIGIYSGKHKDLYDFFYDAEGNVKDGKKPASEIPRICLEYFAGSGNADKIMEVLIRLEEKLSKVKIVADDSEIKDISADIDNFLEMTSFIE